MGFLDKEWKCRQCGGAEYRPEDNDGSTAWKCPRGHWRFSWLPAVAIGGVAGAAVLVILSIILFSGDGQSIYKEKYQEYLCGPPKGQISDEQRLDLENLARRLKLSEDQVLMIARQVTCESTTTPTPEPVITVSPDTSTPLPIQITAWEHVGFGDFGYTYDAAQKQATGGFKLPSLEECDQIRTGAQYADLRSQLLMNVAYWTSDSAPNGRPYAYCFGQEGNCLGVDPDKPYRATSPNDGAAVLLLGR